MPDASPLEIEVEFDQLDDGDGRGHVSAPSATCERTAVEEAR